MLTTLRLAIQETPRQFYQTWLKLALPISLQLMLNSSLALVDVLMVSHLGATAVAAVGLCSRFFFVIILMVSGLATGASVLAAQYVGKGEIAGVQRILSIALLSAILLTLPCSLLTFFMPEKILAWYSNDAALIQAGAAFLKMTAPFHILMAMVSIIAAVLRATGKSLLPMLVGVFALTCNTGLNYLLIFGHFGFPVLGIEGAGLATLLAKSLECMLLVGVLYWQKSNICLTAERFIQSFQLLELKRFLRQSLPLLANEMIWAMGIFAFTIVYSHMGTTALATVAMFTPIESMSIQLFIGLTSAAAILISTRLGAQDFQAAKQAAWLLGALITLAAALYGVLLACSYQAILALYSPNSPQIMQAAPTIIWVIAATLWLRLYNVVACVSILRSGGEAKFTLYVDLVVIWLIVLPLTAACGLLWHWPIQWVFAVAITAEALIKAPIYSLRIQTKQWLTSLVHLKKVE